MGFTTSFVSGLTLTSTLLYWSLLHHQRSRVHQAAILRTSALQLDTLTDAKLASDVATMDEENYSGGLREGIKDHRLVRSKGFERLKDGWNSEIEKGVRWFYGIDWARTRDGLEDRVKQLSGGERRV